MPLPIRLDKHLRDSTACSLRALREACACGQVKIYSSLDDVHDSASGATVTDPATLVYPGQAVTLVGHLVKPRDTHDYLMLHKPLGVTTTTRDPDHQDDLSAWLSRMPPGVFPVGRLDRMTSGLLLFMSDGDLAQAVLLPVHHVQKRYRLSIGGPVQGDDARLLALERGVTIAGHDRPVAALIFQVIPNGNGTTTVALGLREGRHRQIRKMCHAVGLRLLELHREAVGALELDKLASGAFRSLDPPEIESLWQAAGGRDRIRQQRLNALQRRAAAASAAGAPLVELEQWLTANCECRSQPS